MCSPIGYRPAALAWVRRQLRFSEDFAVGLDLLPLNSVVKSPLTSMGEEFSQHKSSVENTNVKIWIDEIIRLL